MTQKQPIQSIGIDTSVLMRLLTGHPAQQLSRVEAILKELSARADIDFVGVSNMVISEAYIAMQLHYKVTKAQARAALLSIFESGYVQPMNGPQALDVIKAASKGCGLVDRLIADDYAPNTVHVLTMDRRMAKLPDVQLIK